MSRLHLDAAQIEREITDLIAAYPDLAEDDAIKADAIEGETGAHEFLSRVMRAVRSEEAMAVATKQAAQSVAEDFKRRQEAAERRAEGLRALAYRILQAAKANGPVRLPEATVSIANVPARVVIEDEYVIPEGFYTTRYVRSIDKDAVKRAVEAGKPVAGAKMTDPSTRLHVRWA